MRSIDMNELVSNEEVVYRRNVISIILISVAAVSVVSCLFIFVGFYSMRNRPSLARNPSSMIIFLAVSDFSLSCTSLLLETTSRYFYSFHE